ncbi:hypothetical protein ACF0H5_020277 [Mactra antiquata]
MYILYLFSVCSHQDIADNFDFNSNTIAGTLFLGMLERIPYGSDYSQHLREIKDLDIRDDDVYLTAFPKCGTHWTWEIMVMLTKGTTEYETKSKECLFLDYTKAAKVDEHPSPRVLNSHYPCRYVPNGLLKKKTKIVHVMRNSKDAFVSYYYHKRARDSDKDYCKDFQTFLPFVTGKYGISLYQPFFEYIKQWESFTQEHPDQILNLFYEDMKEDPVREIKKIDKFLGTNRDSKLIEQIAEACDFQNLKKADAEVKVKEGLMAKGPQFMYRKGEVGDWKNHFTVSMNEQMDKWIDEQSKGINIKFRYTI